MKAIIKLLHRDAQKGKISVKTKGLIFVAIAMLIVGLSTDSLALSFSNLYKESYWEPTGGFNYGTTNFGAGLGNYIGTGSLSNYGSGTVLDFFINSGFTDVVNVGIGIAAGPGNLAGTWSVNSLPPATGVIDFLMIKGTTSFSIHQYNPAAPNGIWNVGYLADAGKSGAPAAMSFVRAYNSTPTSVPVPEPETMLLLGACLLVLVVLEKKKFRSN